MCIKTSAMDLLKNDSLATGIRAHFIGKTIKIKSKIAIGADGIEVKNRALGRYYKHRNYCNWNWGNKTNEIRL